jgi:hypothetical protein
MGGRLLPLAGARSVAFSIMHRNRFAFAISVAGLAATLAISGCASAAASPTRPTSQTAAGSGGSEAHIIVYSINSDGPDFRAIVTGAVGDYGPAVTVHPDGTVDPEHSSEMELRLTHGSFRLGIAGLDAKIVDAYRHWPSNVSTCSGSIGFTLAVPVVAGSGTGSYRGISGSFAVTVAIAEVDVKPVCNGTSEFLSQVILMAGSGAVSF